MPGPLVVVNPDGITPADANDPVRATDADAAQVLTYRLSGADAGSFIIMSDASDTTRGGQISAKAKLDYETKSTYRVTVMATDADNLSASINVTIMVIDMNDAPEVTGDAEKDYPENQTRDVATYGATDPEGGTIYWSLLTALPSTVPVVDGAALVDADFENNADFSISADGVLTFNIRPDHEAPVDDDTPADADNVYNIVVVASDDAPGAAGAMMGYKKVVVTVTDVDESGIVTLSSLQPQVATALTATLIDPEVPVRSPTETWKWEKSRSRNSGWTAIADGTNNVYEPDDTAINNYLRATATYKDADGNNRTAQAVSVNRARAAPATVQAATFVTTPPGGNDNRRVAENSPDGTNVGDPVKASDTVDEVLTYSLTGAIEAGFQINPATGQITVGPRTILDADVTASYTVMVMATEADGVTAETSVTITVNNVNEAPMFTMGATMVEHAENTDVLLVDTYTAGDPETGTTITWSIEGADAGKFNILGGVLTFNDAGRAQLRDACGRGREQCVQRNGCGH